jgi:hypothetical protein
MKYNPFSFYVFTGIHYPGGKITRMAFGMMEYAAGKNPAGSPSVWKGTGTEEVI